MREQLTAQYDSLYAAADVGSFGGGNALPPVLRLPEYLPSGRVLDVGGGDGRHALALARLGYEVTVVDLSTVGLKKLQTAATREHLSITTQVSDVVQEGISAEYDALICTFVLHHLSESDAVKLLRVMKQHARPGGLLMIATFLNQGGLFARNQKSASGRYYPSLVALTAQFGDWQILESFSRETTTLAKDKTDKQMMNGMGVVVAKKR